MTDSLGRYARLAIAAAVLTLTLKTGAALVTGSVGLFSDALESIINLVTSLLLAVILRVAKTPPDPDHHFGHDKAEYFANGAQGMLILLAALGIGSASVQRFLNPSPLEEGPLGLGLALLAALCNFGVARILLKKGEQYRSEALKGESAHLMSDVWTSVAVVLGVGLVFLTKLHWLDPLAALIVCAWIARSGITLVISSIRGLMDSPLNETDLGLVRQVLDKYKSELEIDYHALRSRVAGARVFIAVHILVPGSWTVTQGHQLLHEIEEEIGQAVKGVTLFSHLEPLEEPSSFQDIEIV